MHTERADHSSLKLVFPWKGLTMQSESYVSIIVSDLETHPGMPRLMQSVARQSTGLERTEIIVAGNGAHPPSAPSIWSAITGNDNITLLSMDDDVSPAQARNAAVDASSGDLLLLMRPDFRLDSKYLTTALPLFADNPNVDVMYSDYIRLSPKGGTAGRPGMIQLPDFDETLLQSRNFIGPAVMIRRSAWDASDGFRNNTVYRDWDLWVQLAAAGSEFSHVNYPLSSCEHAKVSFRERAEDGRCKAMIVINNQAFFHMHTVRWALSYLRGETWAQAFGFMTIPGPMEVTRMMHEHAVQQMGSNILAEKAIRQFSTAPLNAEATQ